MPSRNSASGIFMAGMTVLSTNGAFGQAYPNKPIRIVTSGVGGGSDFLARYIALSNSLGQPIIVENRSAGIVPAEIVSKASPDGYTLLVGGGPLWLAPYLRAKVPYDPVRDFLPVTLGTYSPNVLVVHQSVPANSVSELIALAKARPGALNYASGGAGGSNHISPELFKAMAGVNIVHIPYKGTGQAVSDLIGGQVHMMIANAPSVAPHIKSGKLRALAVTSAQPSELVPGLPTVAAAVPGYESGSIVAVLAPAGTPAAIIKYLNQGIVKLLRTADARTKFLNSGVEVVGSSPEELAAKIKAEMVRLGKVIKDAGIREE